MKKNFIRIMSLGLVSTMMFAMAGCGGRTVDPTLSPAPTGGATPTEEPYVEYSVIKINEEAKHQTLSFFGASGAWWAQYVGGWDQKNNYSEVTPRDDIATLLFDKEKGIGLSCYRYNIGAGSRGTGGQYNAWRDSECFESAPGVYDWSKDANAVWFMKKAAELGGKDMNIIMFCNSPLQRLTINGLAQSSKNTKTNIDPKNYEQWKKYVFDVAAHFKAEGVPVVEISPINEPQWEWLPGNQEGMHLDNENMVKILESFVVGIEGRKDLQGVRISGPESGDWNTDTRGMIEAMMKSSVLRNYFTAIDCHSYWSDGKMKEGFMKWLKQHYPDLKVSMSEWCEMVNGSDYTMDSAFNMADEILEDLNIMDAESWQYWVAVSPGGYRDGLLHVSEGKQAYRATKRLWGYGNFTKFIRPGYVRVEAELNYTDIYNMGNVAFTGTNDEGQQELILVLKNEEDAKTFRMKLATSNNYNYYEVYTTNEEKDLQCTANGEYSAKTAFSIEGQSIVTIRLIAK